MTIAGGFALRVDALGAFFLAVVSLVAIPVALYGAGYSEVYEDRRGLPLLGIMLNLFLLTMSLVPLADNVLTFLAVWEGMSLTSYLLVMTESDEPETLRAGIWYLAMTQFGLAFLFARVPVARRAGRYRLRRAARDRPVAVSRAPLRRLRPGR